MEIDKLKRCMFKCAYCGKIVFYNETEITFDKTELPNKVYQKCPQCEKIHWIGNADESHFVGNSNVILT